MVKGTGRGRSLARLLVLGGLLLAVAVPTQAVTASASPTLKLGLYDQPMSQLRWNTMGLPSPQIAVTYYAWGEGFQAGFSQLAAARGAEPFVELGSWQCTWLCQDTSAPTLSSIAAGTYDKTYLIPFAYSLASYGHPVLITWDHEMNGLYGPYPWMNQPPAQYIAAWRHVYDVMHPIAPNAIWVWAPNAQIGEGGVARYFPGQAYMQEWGVDCYLSAPGQSYASACASTVAVIRGLTPDPGMLSETGIENKQGRPARVTQLVRAVRAAGLAALVWFDKGGSFLYRPGRDAMREALR
jgi:Glycosyl hydrolase family 26